jgi:ribosomal protein L17
MLRNMVTSIIMEERIETTVIKAKAVRPQVEKMITLGKKGDLAARRQAASYLMTGEAVTKLFDTVAPRFGDRKGGYLRIVRTAWRKTARPWKMPTPKRRCRRTSPTLRPRVRLRAATRKSNSPRFQQAPRRP